MRITQSNTECLHSLTKIHHTIITKTQHIFSKPNILLNAYYTLVHILHELNQLILLIALRSWSQYLPKFIAKEAKHKDKANILRNKIPFCQLLGELVSDCSQLSSFPSTVFREHIKPKVLSPPQGQPTDNALLMRASESLAPLH